MISREQLPASKHFTFEQLTNGVFACTHKSGGAAYSNSGIVNLGDRTILVDAFDTQAAGRDLRQTAETLFDRSVQTIDLTHPHSDHWIGASVFDADTIVLASKITRRVSMEWGAEIVEDFKDSTAWEEWVEEMESQLQTEHNVHLSLSIEKSLTRTRYIMAEMSEFSPRYADMTFEDTITFQGTQRNAELRSLGRGHSEDDAVLFLPTDGIAFIGDIGFFNSQPFLGFCDFDLYRKQMHFLQEADYSVLVPGHGLVGSKDDIDLQLKYLEVMEDVVGNAVKRGDPLDKVLEITLPEPFDRWMREGMNRFEANVRYLFTYLGGELLEEIGESGVP